MKIGVIGTGRVGLPFAVMSSKYFDTIGVDVSSDLVSAINQRIHFAEPRVDEYLSRYGLKASTDFRNLSERDLIFFFVGSQTPGVGYSSKNLLAAIDMTAPYLTSRNVVVISTTIPPEEVNASLLPHLKAIGLESKTRGIIYNPAMIALGSVVDNFEKPNYVLVGEMNKSAGDSVEGFWRTIIGDNVPIFRSSISNIALGKYVLNMGLVLKITLMNLATELSEKTEGDIDVLSQILKADPRIAGPKMFRGGLGYGGTCFPVDVEAVRHECERSGVPTGLADAVAALNDWQVTRSVALVESFGKKRIAILGLTYKPDTSITVASQAIQIARRLAEDKLQVTVYDPEGLQVARAELGESVAYASSAREAISSTDIIFLAVEWSEFSDLGPNDFRGDQVVVDPWRLLREKQLPCTYRGFGLGGAVK